MSFLDSIFGTKNSSGSESDKADVEHSISQPSPEIAEEVERLRNERKRERFSDRWSTQENTWGKDRAVRARAKLYPFSLINKNSGSTVALLSISFDSQIDGICEQTRIIQEYENKESVPIETLFCFPTKYKATINEMIIETGEKTITGVAEAAEDAEKIYIDAIEDGDGASLLNYEAGDITSLSIGNINSGQKIKVTIGYVAELDSMDDMMRLSLPFTIGHRYANESSDAVLTDKITESYADEVPYKIACRISVLNQGIEMIESPTHKIKISYNEGRQVVELSEGESKFDHDFVLTIKSKKLSEPIAVIGTHDNGSSALLMRFTPEIKDESMITPTQIDTVFVVDCSGSMQGDPIEQVKIALNLCIRAMMKGDRFNIVLFGSSSLLVYTKFMEVNEGNFNDIEKVISLVSADMGGTELLSAIEMAYDCSSDPERKFNILLLTDGGVYDQENIIAYVKRQKHASLFTIGIGFNTSQHAIEGIAKAGGGKSENIQPGERIEPVVLRQFSRMRQNSFTKIAIHPENLKLCDSSSLPAMFIGDSITFYSEVNSIEDRPSLSISAECEGQKYLWTCGEIPVEKSKAIPSICAKHKIESSIISEEYNNVIENIVGLAKKFNLMTKYTSLVAVEKRKDEEKTTTTSPKFMRMPLPSFCRTESYESYESTQVSFSRMLVERGDELCNFSIVPPAVPNIKFDAYRLSPDMKKSKDDIDYIIELLQSQNVEGSFADYEGIKNCAKGLKIKILSQKEYLKAVKKLSIEIEEHSAMKIIATLAVIAFLEELDEIENVSEMCLPAITKANNWLSEISKLLGLDIQKPKKYLSNVIEKK